MAFANILKIGCWVPGVMSDSPGTQTPGKIDTPGTQTPGKIDSPGPQTPGKIDSPGSQTPGKIDSPGIIPRVDFYAKFD